MYQADSPCYAFMAPGFDAKISSGGRPGGLDLRSDRGRRMHSTGNASDVMADVDLGVKALWFSIRTIVRALTRLSG